MSHPIYTRKGVARTESQSDRCPLHLPVYHPIYTRKGVARTETQGAARNSQMSVPLESTLFRGTLLSDAPLGDE